MEDRASGYRLPAPEYSSARRSEAHQEARSARIAKRRASALFRALFDSGKPRSAQFDARTAARGAQVASVIEPSIPMLNVPRSLFVVHHGVGSEEWSADGFSRRM